MKKAKQSLLTIGLIIIVIAVTMTVTSVIVNRLESAAIDRFHEHMEYYVITLEELLLFGDYVPSTLMEIIREDEALYTAFHDAVFWVLPVVGVISVLVLRAFLLLMERKRLKKSKDDLTQTHKLYLEALSNANTMFIDYDKFSGQFVIAKIFANRHGIPEIIPDIAQYCSSYELIFEGSDEPLSFGLLLNKIKNGSNIAHRTFCFKATDGKSIWYKITITSSSDDTKIVQRALVVLQDITDEKESELLLKIKAEQDMLTGLYNKTSGISHIDSLIQDSREGSIHALFVIDIDNFKAINDVLGHDVGDKVIVDVARILTALFRQSDILCRFGGDEYVAFASNISDKNIALNKASEICTALRKSYGDGVNEVAISASIGIALFPFNGHSYEELFSNADAALYKVKKQSKNAFVLYGS